MASASIVVRLHPSTVGRKRRLNRLGKSSCDRRYAEAPPPVSSPASYPARQVRVVRPRWQRRPPDQDSRQIWNGRFYSRI